MRLHLVRLGQPHPDRPTFYCAARYSRDWMARHWSIDFRRWRLCLIRRHL